MRDLIAGLMGRGFTIWSRFFRKNITVGDGLKIYSRFKISGSGTINIGNNCAIDGIRGDNSQYVSLDVSHGAIIRIGHNVSLHAARISAKYEIVIGNDVLIEESGVIDSDFHSIDKSRENPTDESPEKCKVSIGDRVFIGARSFITKGVVVGHDVNIFPGSIVTSSVKPGVMICGNPARPLIEKINN